LYRFKNYQQEADAIITRLKKEHPAARTLLDVACGTAEHARYLSAIYQVDGVDINSDFVAIAARKNPAGQFSQADMMDFNLGKTYDIVLCLFSSIGYIKTLENMVKTLRYFEKRLNPGGIVLVEPWFEPAAWHPLESVYMLTGESAEGKVCRMNFNEQEGNLSIINFHYIVGTETGVTYFSERHELGLFARQEKEGAFKQAGLTVEFDLLGITGRGLYLAKRVSDL